MEKVTKISFVCHGNICRSPMAEFIFKKLIKEQNVEHKFYVDSKAVSYEEEGNPVYPPAKLELKKHGISCDGKVAVTVQRSDYDKYDYFIVMDNSNVRRIHNIFGGDSQNKVYKLLSFCNCDDDVSDPWYTDRFDIAYRDIEKGCIAFLEYLLKNN